MIQEAISVGELVRALADRGAEGRVSRTFHSSAYIRVEDGVVLLMRGDLRSPMTVNIGGVGDLGEIVAVGDRVGMDGASLTSPALEVRLNRAGVYRGRLGAGGSVSPIAKSDVVKAATLLKLLYSVSGGGLAFVEGKALGDFARNVLLPFARGELGGVYEARNYRKLVGSGIGFTPAGDDFVAGFVSSFNLAAGAIGARRIALPMGELSSRTVPESASILNYAQRGYVDEGLERLILAAFGGKSGGFRNQIVELARRGHTSGLDMSLGVALSVASVIDCTRGGRALESSFRALRDS